MSGAMQGARGSDRGKVCPLAVSLTEKSGLSLGVEESARGCAHYT